MNKPFYCLEVQIDADLEEITTEAAAEAFTASFMDDLMEMIGLHIRGASIHVSYHLRHDLMEYEGADGVDRSAEGQQAADGFVERVRAALEKINAGDDHASSDRD